MKCLGSAMCLILLTDIAQCFPVLGRARRYIPPDFEFSLEVPGGHFGRADDYGVLPEDSVFLHRTTRQKPKGLLQALKSKRDDPDIGELYYDDIM